MKLTKRVIDNLTYTGDGNERCVIWDDSLPGFGLRIYPTGRKAFVLSYRVQGRKRLLTLGMYGVLTLEQARDKARQEMASVIGGADPLEDRQRAAQGETIKELCTSYIERHAKAHKKTWQQDEKRINRRILPKWGNRRTASVTRADVAKLHSEIGDEGHPYEANRVVELLAKMFDLARLWGFLSDDQRNPAHGIEAYREQKRDRWVTPEELPRLAEAIDAEPNPYIRAALWLYMLTGARKSELLRACWDDVNWQRAELRLPDTKAGRVHYIPLTAPAQTLLRDLPPLEGNPHIFPGREQGAPLVNIEKAWRRVRTAAGVEDVRLHDLRRTVGSWLAQAGNTLHLIGRVLNHSNASTTAVYARFGEDHVRAALESHAQRIMGIAGKAPAADVVPLEPTKPGKGRAG